MKNLMIKWMLILLIACLLMTPMASMEELLNVEESSMELNSEAIQGTEPTGDGSDSAIEEEPGSGVEVSSGIEEDEIIVSTIDEIVSEETGDFVDESDTGVQESESEAGFISFDAQDAATGLIEAEDSNLEMQEEIFVDDFLPDSDTLFEGYIDQLFHMGNSAFFESRNLGGDLTGQKKMLYDELSSFFVEVAAGKRASTIFIYTDDGTLSSDDAQYVRYCALRDHPYEVYWYVNYCYVSSSRDAATGRVTWTFKYEVSGVYQNGDEFTFDTSKASSTIAAASNARAIVKKYASVSDYDKLVGYLNEICAMVSFNSDAASDNWDPDANINPWQLIWVFDGDPDTNVVSQGYTKAYQYLCDLTDFAGDITCCQIRGDSNGSSRRWNIVHMPNGKNYHVDVTWCDKGSKGVDKGMFLRGSSSCNPAIGYSIDNIFYMYDDVSKTAYSVQDRTISTNDYLDDIAQKEKIVDNNPAPTPTLVPTITANKRNSKATITAAPGALYQLDLGGATGKQFKSSKKKVAVVDKNGLVTVKNAGRTKITFKVGRKKRTVTLRVMDPTVPGSVTLNLSGTVIVKKGDTATLTAAIPEGTMSGIKWRSSNKNVATVNVKGVVKFKKKGKVTITATTVRGNRKAKVIFRVKGK